MKIKKKNEYIRKLKIKSNELNDTKAEQAKEKLKL